MSGGSVVRAPTQSTANSGGLANPSIDTKGTGYLKRVLGRRLSISTLVGLLDETYKNSAGLPGRILYNRACYLATSGNAENQHERDAQALKDLDAALSDASFARWASKDPSLRGLRTRERKKFAAIIRAHSLPSDEPEGGLGGDFAQLSIVGNRWSTRLAADNIHTIDDLHDELKSQTGQQRVAERLKVPEPLVRRWKDTCDVVVEIDGVGVTFANLLILAGAASFQPLAEWEGKESEFHELLAALGEMAGAKRNPSLHEVTDWIRQARQQSKRQ